MLNLYQEFEKSFRKHADKIALFSSIGNFTYADLSTISAKIANYLLSLGIKAGDRVAVQVEKSPYNLFLYLACLRAGIIYLPLNSGYTDEELSYFFNDAEPKLVFSDFKKEKLSCASLYEKSLSQSELHSIENTKPDDIAVILYTSGTTGKPKGAMITHKGLLCNANDLNHVWGITEKDRILHMLPLFHVHGLFFACHTVFLAGASIIFSPKFDVEQFFTHLPNATVFMGVPTYYIRLLQGRRLTRDACRHMRLFISGSAPLLSSTFDEFRARTGHVLLERYGMTETGINASNPLQGERKVGTVGLPLPSVSIRIVNEEIQVKGNNLFKGYWRKPEKTAEDMTEDGYFKTGDLGRFDKDGFLTIIGRAKDLIITGGLNVYPAEIETTLNEMDGVLESAVIGVPHKDYGEAVVAVISGDSKKLNEQNVIELLKKHHAGFKCPKKVFFVDQLPKNTMGKVEKKELRRRFEQTFAEVTVRARL